MDGKWSLDVLREEDVESTERREEGVVDMACG